MVVKNIAFIENLADPLTKTLFTKKSLMVIRIA